MKRVVIGFDTSCYTTSVAAVTVEGQVIASCRKLLPVKLGERGLRQSEGVWHHVRALPERLEELDAEIQAASPRWNVSRMPKVDLTILRLAAWEILHEEDVPGSVAINEAVNLATRYSEPTSGRFVNGVLGTILRKKEAAQ